MVVRILLIMTDQLLIVFRPQHKILLYELDQPIGVRILLIVKV